MRRSFKLILKNIGKNIHDNIFCYYVDQLVYLDIYVIHSSLLIMMRIHRKASGSISNSMYFDAIVVDEDTTLMINSISSSLFVQCFQSWVLFAKLPCRFVWGQISHNLICNIGGEILVQQNAAGTNSHQIAIRFSSKSNNTSTSHENA